MLNKDMFLKHSNDQVAIHIKKLIRPYPDTKDLQMKLQNYYEWNQFKRDTVHELTTSARARRRRGSSLAAFGPASLSSSSIQTMQAATGTAHGENNKRVSKA